jgi:hypothetical protein
MTLKIRSENVDWILLAEKGSLKTLTFGFNNIRKFIIQVSDC